MTTLRSFANRPCDECKRDTLHVGCKCLTCGRVYMVITPLPSIKKRISRAAHAHRESRRWAKRTGNRTVDKPTRP